MKQARFGERLGIRLQSGDEVIADELRVVVDSLFAYGNVCCHHWTKLPTAKIAETRGVYPV